MSRYRVYDLSGQDMIVHENTGKRVSPTPLVVPRIPLIYPV
jgi:hypothetical protein